jgi:hypothetical protein
VVVLVQIFVEVQLVVVHVLVGVHQQVLQGVL